MAGFYLALVYLGKAGGAVNEDHTAASVQEKPNEKTLENPGSGECWFITIPWKAAPRMLGPWVSVACALCRCLHQCKWDRMGTVVGLPWGQWQREVQGDRASPALGVLITSG